MGTKIQCKTYLPGFFSMGDLNNSGTNIPWLLNHESNSRKNSQCADSVLSPRPVDGYFQFDKEKVRQTILKQETVFRHQLQELHRLYRRQRDLMNEHQMKETLNHRAKIYQSSPSLSHVPSSDTKRAWQVSHFPSLDSIAGQLSTSDAAKNRSSSNFIENDSRSSNHLTKSPKESEFYQPSSIFFKGNMFDSRFVIDAKRPVAGALVFRSGADTEKPIFSKRTDALADLNKPLPLHEAPPLVPDMNIRSITCLDDDICNGGKFSPKSLKERIGGICLNHPPCQNGEEQLTFNLNADLKRPDNGSSVRFEVAENLPKAFQSSEGHDVSNGSLFREAKTEHQRKKRIFGVDILEENQMQSASCSKPLSRTYTELLRDVESYRGNIHTNSDVRSPPSSKDVLSHRNMLSSTSRLISEEVRGCDFASGRENCYHLNLDSLQNYAQQFFRREDTTVNSSHVLDQKIEVSDSTKIRTIFGVPIFSVSNDSHASGALSKATFPDIDSVTATKITGDRTVSRNEADAKDFVRETGRNGCLSGLRHQIDLNLSLDEEEAPSLPPLPQAVVRIATTEIDLEAPAVLESEAECENSKRASRGCDESNEAAMRLAAESIISISTSGTDGEMNDMLENDPSDCLKWFAQLVSCTECGFDEELVPEDFDYFELMTLKLEDMKEEEYKMPTLENHNDEATGAVTLPKRPRRGQARRGRQRRDFQRDVLPGIISLSRYEVNKDILAFEELFKASGMSWQSTLSHRKNGKNGKGRKRLIDADSSPPIPIDCTPLVNQPCFSELGLEEKSLTGWGKRTRRLPRQRYLNSNLAPPLKTKKLVFK